MTRKFLLITLACLFCLSPADAQKRKAKKAVKVEEVEPEPTPEELLFQELLPSTAKIMFIDSVVVDKASFLDQLQLPRESGRIVRDGQRSVYTNEFANTQIYASGNGNARALFISHKYGEKWEKATKLTELGSANLDYPFLMTDGVTLYFSAKGEGTVGGSDIFRTTFDSEDSRFYEPVNMGLPFNSPANEYLLAISDYDNIGWLVSDRFQPEGKVCIYTFEPTDQRRTFEEDDLEEEQLKPFAFLQSIKDTWAFGNRNAAINRKLDIAERNMKKQENNDIFFVVNDKVTYTKLSDFKNPDHAVLYQQIAASKKRLEQSRKLLDMTRISYSETEKSKRENIGRNILELEKEITALEQTIIREEKNLRNSLNK